jgi:hypothetical protein
LENFLIIILLLARVRKASENSPLPLIEVFHIAFRCHHNQNSSMMPITKSLIKK